MRAIPAVLKAWPTRATEGADATKDSGGGVGLGPPCRTMGARQDPSLSGTLQAQVHPTHGIL